MKTFVAAQRACLLAVPAVLILGISSPSSAQMKEGTYSGTYSGFGTAKATPIGKDRLLVAVDETGFTLTNGFLDHVTWHCWGTADYSNGMGQIQGGYCVGTDPAGDQLAITISDEKHAPDQKSWNGSVNLTAGTGKYTGISGSGAYVIHGNAEFRQPQGSYVDYSTIQGNYKIP
jgi:hypothetical protein